MVNEILVWCPSEEGGEFEVEIILDNDGNSERIGFYQSEAEAMKKVSDLLDENPDLFFDEEAHEMAKEEQTAVDVSPEQNVYKLRAEFYGDIEALKQKILLHDPAAKVDIQKIVSYLPDAEAEIESTLSFKELKAAIAEIPDGHVMYETVQPIGLYTGERNGIRAEDEDQLSFKIRMALVGRVSYDQNTGNYGDEDLIDASYYDEDQDYTIIGTSDSEELALDELVYNIKNDPRFDLNRFFQKHTEDKKGTLKEAAEKVQAMNKKTSPELK